TGILASMIVSWLNKRK
ncbi:TPA: type I toxin-antitoxin system toxin Ldr family protein, partial [Escherichia coli]|nr:type I toxin-antitoxin system toxin Ldr family protein [Escherichia coli]HAZ5107581.1 type I toxin-antitoxin system toxin Ldr family protein [Escherichia coli]HDS7127794.1 type I toxin-antitoxin system toxin Ldr family protein [Escherichia coli]